MFIVSKAWYISANAIIERYICPIGKPMLTDWILRLLTV